MSALSKTMTHRLRVISARLVVACPDRTDMALEKRGLIEFSKPHENAILTKKMTITDAGKSAIGLDL